MPSPNLDEQRFASVVAIAHFYARQLYKHSIVLEINIFQIIVESWCRLIDSNQRETEVVSYFVLSTITKSGVNLTFCPSTVKTILVEY